MCEMMETERERESGEEVVDSLLSLMAVRRVDKSLIKPQNALNGIISCFVNL